MVVKSSAELAEPFLGEGLEVGFGERARATEATGLDAFDVRREFGLLGGAELHQRADSQFAEQGHDREAVDGGGQLEDIAGARRARTGVARTEDEPSQSLW